MDGRVQVQDRVFAVRDGVQVYGRVAELGGETDGNPRARVTTYKGDVGSWHNLDAVIVSHRYVPQEPPKIRQDLLPARSSQFNR